MFSNQFAELSLNAPCKALTAVKADKVESRFIVGTCGGRHNHEAEQQCLHVVRFHSEVNEIGIDASLPHPTGRVEHVVASPQDRTLVLTVAEHSSTATLYKLPPAVMELTNEFQPVDDDEDESHQSYSHHHDSATSVSSNRSSSVHDNNRMEQKLSLEPSSSNAAARLTDIVWRGVSDLDDFPSHSNGDVLTLDETGVLTQWDLSLGMAESMRSFQAYKNSDAHPTSCLLAPPRLAWDPHNGNAMAVSHGRSVYIVDGRLDSNSVPAGTVDCIRNGHRYGVAHLDYNPNKPHVMATAGLDGLVHFWDLRSAARPLLTARGAHTHYVWDVRYNPFHDQLIVSTGTDGMANLWRCSTISSAPLLTLEEETAQGGGGASNDDAAPNVRVARFEHGDACYASAWGAADAWLYLTAGYDGRVVLHHVPSKEKYKILL